jgi:hypothetical protein
MSSSARRRRPDEKLPALILSLALAGSLWACREGGGAADYTHIDDLAPLTLVEEVRIGSVDDPDVGFSRIGRIHVDADGMVFVHESTDQQIRLYDAEGRFVRSYGRRGDGPGEFRVILGFGLLGDTLWVSDGGARRLTLFSRSGDLLHTVSPRVMVQMEGLGRYSGAPSGSIYPNELGPRGEILGRPSSPMYPNLPDSIVRIPVIRFDTTGAILDTVETTPTVISYRAAEFTYDRPEGGRSTSYIRIGPPVSDSATVLADLRPDDHVGPDHRVAIHWAVTGSSTPSGVLTVTRTTPAGDTVMHGGVGYAPRAVTPEFLDSVADQRPRGLRLPASDSAELARFTRSVMQWPPHHQPTVQWEASDEGTIRLRLSEADASANRWVVFTGDGRVRGLVDLEPATRIQWLEGDRMWVVETDAFEVPWLVRYRLEDPPAR